MYYTGGYTWIPRLFDCDLRRVLFSSLPFLELHYCTGAYRISPTDVNSRPSSCLTNFLLNGKQGKLSVFYLHIVRSVDPQTKYPFSATHLGWTAGRSVLLEQPRKSGSKVISHMLSSHGGEIFLHVLNSNRSTLEDPPSISEGCGGRVTDYRITVRSVHTPTHPPVLQYAGIVFKY